MMTIQEMLQVLDEAIDRLRQIAEDEIDEDLAYRARQALAFIRRMLNKEM